MAVKNEEAAKETYSWFISLLKWSVPLIAIIVLIVVILIAE